MCNALVSFKWLDILEKEFDKAFVNIDLLLGEFGGEEAEIILPIRKKLATMCSCFSQLSHKAMTIFQINAKAEAELVNLRSEIIEMKLQNQSLEKEVHSLLIQLHSKQLEQLNLSSNQQKETIKDSLKRDLTEYSPIRVPYSDIEKTLIMLKNWKKRLQAENELLRCTIVNLQAEVCGARLAAKYLDKELAGRIQQLQLLSREDMNNEIKTKLWDQLDAEILLQRHKTVIKVMRQQKNHSLPPEQVAGRVRNVYLTREPNKGLGISVTGGREHGVPIIISELEPWCVDKKLYVGDAILSVNGIDLNQLTHKEAVKILSSQIGNVILTVITLSEINLSEIEDETNFPSYLSYPFYEDIENKNEYFPRSGEYDTNTPTAPRTPPSRSTESVKSSPEKVCDSNKPDEVNSESELFGITTLQKIFRTVSAIESAPKSQSFECCETSSSSVCERNNYGENHIQEVEPTTNKTDFPKDKFNSTKIPSSFNSSVPFDQIDHPTKVISGIGDSSVGTPV